MLLLSKIDYGIYIYGSSPKTTLRIIQPSYHQAARRSINAFPTTPLKNILAEAGLPSIEQRFEQTISKLVVKLVFSTNSVIDKDIHQAMNLKCRKRIPSALKTILDKAREMDIPTKTTKYSTLSYPPWSIKANSFVLSLAHYSKTNTSNAVYQSLFSSISSELKTKGWKFIFTDGSKSKDNTSFAVTFEDGQILNIGILPEYASIFTAEAFAILQATKSIRNSNDKFVICSDSISVLKAVKNPNNDSDLISAIRNKIIMKPNKIKLMWTPGHSKIRGNEEADKAATSTNKSPVYKFNIYTKKDLKTQILDTLRRKQEIEWSLYHHHYKKINEHKTYPQYPTNVSKQKISNYIRLRLGHTSTTHKHLLNKNNPPICSTCNTTMSLTHLLENCQSSKPALSSIFKNISIYDVLKNPTSSNIENSQ
ncbi:uncharacterized protein LOC129947266 [Eupeodes corollae]|uniref:uncharacterized protein LOC129947266 n=1 Tax=Eupeodes corollae TaxID=290404 RepID=UPI002493CF49|nr:uncharacterized protein LOC129947266 [Eupeodes corollae]